MTGMICSGGSELMALSIVSSDTICTRLAQSTKNCSRSIIQYRLSPTLSAYESLEHMPAHLSANTTMTLVVLFSCQCFIEFFSVREGTPQFKDV